MKGQPESPKARLLSGAIAYVAEHGAADVSLRELAAELGTSHRMLIYHFGSKEGLLVEIVRAVEQAQRDALSQLVDQGASLQSSAIFWHHLADPSLAPFARLFFEVYGQALQGRSWATPLLDGVVDDWVQPIAATLRARGERPAVARAEARLAVAVTRGLLLDLLATGDRRAVEAAARRFFLRFEDPAKK